MSEPLVAPRLRDYRGDGSYEDYVDDLLAFATDVQTRLLKLCSYVHHLAIDCESGMIETEADAYGLMSRAAHDDRTAAWCRNWLSEIGAESLSGIESPEIGLVKLPIGQNPSESAR